MRGLRLVVQLAAVAIANVSGLRLHSIFRAQRAEAWTLRASNPVGWGARSVALTGLFTFNSTSLDISVPSMILEQSSEATIRILSDSPQLSRSRAVSPSMVYNGMIDTLTFQPLTSERAFIGVDTWLAFCSSSDTLSELIDLAHHLRSLRRCVFVLNGASHDMGRLKSCERASFDWTILHSAQCAPLREGVIPFHLAANAHSRDGSNPGVALGDLYRIAVECLWTPKTSNRSLAVLPGTVVDQEVQRYMRSQGWSPGVQLDILLSSAMASIEARYHRDSVQRCALSTTQSSVSTSQVQNKWAWG